jgi:hypothetical protein
MEAGVKTVMNFRVHENDGNFFASEQNFRFSSRTGPCKYLDLCCVGVNTIAYISELT